MKNDITLEDAIERIKEEETEKFKEKWHQYDGDITDITLVLADEIKDVIAYVHACSELDVEATLGGCGTISCEALNLAVVIQEIMGWTEEDLKPLIEDNKKELEEI